MRRDRELSVQIATSETFSGCRIFYFNSTKKERNTKQTVRWCIIYYRAITAVSVWCRFCYDFVENFSCAGVMNNDQRGIAFQLWAGEYSSTPSATAPYPARGGDDPLSITARLFPLCTCVFGVVSATGSRLLRRAGRLHPEGGRILPVYHRFS